MGLRAWIITVFGCALWAQASCAPANNAITVRSDPPNIVLILADDAGYADFGFQGSREFLTPHLDRLAEKSLKFSQAYVTAAVCGPSRAGLLTGQYQQKFGYEENNVPGYMSHSSRLMGHEMGLPLGQKTIADYLRELGYRTGLIGKWHQGNADRYHPLERGFDEFVWFRGGARSYFTHSEEHFKSRPEDRWEYGFGKFKEPDEYLTDVMADEANLFISKNKEKPFFLMLSFTAVHTPMEARPEDLVKFPNLEGKRQTLAAMTLAMDEAVGKVLATLEAEGLMDNTIIVFTNDNGGPSDTNVSNNAPLSGTKANHLEGGIRVPMLWYSPGKNAVGETYKFPVSTLDFVPTFLNAAGGNTENLVDIDGVDLTPFINGKVKTRPHQTLYWKKENRAAIRYDDWKLVRFPDRPAELYDLASDISEAQNIAPENPKLVEQLYQELFDWELTLERPLWMLRREYEGKAMDRMDDYHVE